MRIFLIFIQRKCNALTIYRDHRAAANNNNYTIKGL